MKVLRRQSVMLKVRGVIQQAIEKARQEKKIGSNLEATVALTLPAEGFDHPVFNDPATLHEFLILSDLKITRGGDLSAVVQESTHCKCARCGSICRMWEPMPSTRRFAEGVWRRWGDLFLRLAYRRFALFLVKLRRAIMCF